MIFRTLIILLCFLFAVYAEAKDKIELKTSRDTAAYCIGMQWGMNFKRDSLMFNPDIIKAGMYDAMFGDTTLLNMQQMQQSLIALQNEIKEKMKAKQEAMDKVKMEEGKINKEKGKAFLEANKKKEGVKELPSGLQYKIIKEGTGKKPTTTSKVKVHYHGTLIDGKVFDSSVERGDPITFGVTQVIKGWTEALQLMKQGAKWTLYIPFDLAYGDNGSGTIPPGAALIFEVELIEVID